MRSSPVEHFSDKEEIDGPIPSAPTQFAVNDPPAGGEFYCELVLSVYTERSRSEVEGQKKAA